MAKIVEDTLIGSTLSFNTSDGLTIVRRFVVSEIEGNPFDILIGVIQAFPIPQPGQQHPSGEPVFVESIQANPLGAGQGEVLITYKPFSVEESRPREGEDNNITRTLSATVQSVDTNLFIKKGKKQLMVTQYQWPEGNSPGRTNPDKQVGLVKKEVPSIVVSQTRTEGNDPYPKALKFVGKVNSNAEFEGRKANKREWLCTKIDGRTTDGGVTWQVDYEFQFNIDTWDVTVAYVDPRTDKPPEDVGPPDQKEALKTFQIYEEIDFSTIYD